MQAVADCHADVLQLARRQRTGQKRSARKVKDRIVMCDLFRQRGACLFGRELKVRMKVIKSTVPFIGTRTLHTLPYSKSATQKPPRIAGVELSGWPSMEAARSMMFS